MVYGIYNELVPGANLNQLSYRTGASHCRYTFDPDSHPQRDVDMCFQLTIFISGSPWFPHFSLVLAINPPSNPAHRWPDPGWGPSRLAALGWAGWATWARRVQSGGGGGGQALLHLLRHGAPERWSANWDVIGWFRTNSWNDIHIRSWLVSCGFIGCLSFWPELELDES